MYVVIRQSRGLTYVLRLYRFRHSTSSSGYPNWSGAEESEVALREFLIDHTSNSMVWVTVYSMAALSSTWTGSS